MVHRLRTVTCNISGLKDDKKRNAVFNYLRCKQFDIVFLQETYCHFKKDEKKWSREWGGYSIWSKGGRRSRGVTVLFKQKGNFVVKNELIDPNGRYIVFDLEYNEQFYRYVNIYTPNNEYERVKFINSANEWLHPEYENLVAGDFNCTLNSETDRINCVGKNDVGQVDIKYLMRNHRLEDTWRRRNPVGREYSWCRGDKASRIDYWLVSESLGSQIENIKYVPCIFSDHKWVEMNINTEDLKQGRGVWKMNERVIKSDLFRMAFKTCGKTGKVKRTVTVILIHGGIWVKIK